MTQDPPTATFEALGLRSELLRAVEAAGYERPTPIQSAIIAAVLAGRDVLARADTGSGKTAAFGLPLLQQLIEHPRERGGRGNRVAVLVIEPTRELVMQTADVLQGFGRGMGRGVGVVAAHGGVAINPQMMAMRGGADVLVATPGRLLDLKRQGAVELSGLRVVVLDEADRLLGTGFREEIDEVLGMLPARRQSLMLSATLSREVVEVARGMMPGALEADAGGGGTNTITRTRSGAEGEADAAGVLDIKQQVYVVDVERKGELLVHLLRERALGQVLVFVSAKKTGDLLQTKLKRAEVFAALFHGDKSQHERTQRLEQFRGGQLRVLIATDLAGRGLDLEELGTVINFELPRSPNDYIHRIGRTGRAGRAGLAISLICAAEEQHFRVIEKRIKQRLKREQIPGFEPRG